MDGQVTTFAVLNFVIAAICIVIALLFGAVMIYGVYYSGDPPEKVQQGLLGSLIFAIPSVVGGVIYLLAGIGLSRRVQWGYYLHIVGAVLAVLSCVGVIYTVFALVVSLREDFRDELI